MDVDIKLHTHDLVAVSDMKETLVVHLWETPERQLRVSIQNGQQELIAIRARDGHLVGIEQKDPSAPCALPLCCVYDDLEPAHGVII